MRRKILLIIMVTLFILLVGFFIKRVYKDKIDIFEDEMINIVDDINELSTKLNRYSIKSTGELAISANYKGAHGENFPHDFNFNYVLSKDKLFFENNNGYNSLSINQELIGFIKNMNKKIDMNKLGLGKFSYNFTSPSYEIGTTYLNSVYNTDFKNMKATIYFNNFLSNKVDRTVIELDNITITKTGESYVIEVDNYKIKFNFNKNGYSLNINDDIKMNVFNETTNDRYTLVKGNYVYSFTINNDSIDFVASTGASIYNSLEVIATYKDYELKKEKELDIIENPITRYFSEVK